MLKDGDLVGAIGIYCQEVRPFTDKQVELVSNFAKQAVIAIENTRLLNELRQRTGDLKGSFDQQTATADVLKVISRSAFDLEPCFDAIVPTASRSATRRSHRLRLRDGDKYRMGANMGCRAVFLNFLSSIRLRRSAANLSAARSRPEKFTCRTAGRSRIRGPRIPERWVSFVQRLGFRFSQGWPDGCHRPDADGCRRFAEKQIELINTFTDQAVIAIENVRLFNETQEALEQQAATAEILKVIASSPADVQPVFDAIATSANRLIGGFSTAVHRVIDDVNYLVAFTPTNPESDEALKAAFPRHRSEVPSVALVGNGETAQIADAETADAQTRQLGRARGWRSVTFTPLMSQGTLIGYIACTRRETGVLADHYVQLLRTFADQAVIAIENVRRFNETKEALERQTATAEILKVIASSPSDVQPVFAAIANSANRLLGGFSTAVFRFLEGDVHLAAFTPTNPAADKVLTTRFPQSFAEFPAFDWVRGGAVAQIADTESGAWPGILDLARARGFRAMLLTPLMSNGIPIGLISVTRRNPGSFADHHVQLLQTFADQAVIAIENVRLFNETQQSLARQAATTEILEVVNSSPGNLTPVFDAILEKATLLSNSAFGALAIHNGDDMHQIVAMRGMPAEFPDFLRGPVRLGPETGLGRLVRGESFVHIIDAADDEAYRLGNPVRRALVDIAGARSYLAVPIAKDGILLGSFTIYRREVRPFEADVIALLQNFATQAAIAIQNARLFNETKEALEQQTATADVLKVIASSPVGRAAGVRRNRRTVEPDRRWQVPQLCTA